MNANPKEETHRAAILLHYNIIVKQPNSAMCCFVLLLFLLLESHTHAMPGRRAPVVAASYRQVSVL